jgi:hypothetical protein
VSEDGAGKREFARVALDLRVRFRVLDDLGADRLAERLREAPSVWAPEDEGELLKIAVRGGAGAEATLARAILGLSTQIVRLNQRVFEEAGPAEPGRLEQLSGGGGLLASGATLAPGSRLDLRLADDDPEAPPIRLLAEIVRLEPISGHLHAFRIAAIHTADRERLIRYLHGVQRRALRQASRERAGA